jgi:predicted DNA-binding protein
MRKHKPTAGLKEVPVKRTSVPIPLDLVRRAKAEAALAGKTLAQVIAEALEAYLKKGEQR